jgi:hypothetical protein
MKDVERVRATLVHTFRHALQRSRYLVSGIEDANEIIAKLSGESGDSVLAIVVDTVLLELGHATKLDALDPNCSATRRAVTRKVAPRGATV